jgi:hypothetical protein
MSLLKTRTIQVVPRTAGSYVKGRWTGEAAGTPHNIQGTWQPATETEIQRLPEGRRERSVFRLYTKSLLNSLSQTKNPDRVTVDGVTYELYAREKWGNGLIPHYKYLATEVV